MWSKSTKQARAQKKRNRCRAMWAFCFNLDRRVSQKYFGASPFAVAAVEPSDGGKL